MCWEGKAFDWAIYEAILAARWRPYYIFRREFWDNLIVSHLFRLFEGYKYNKFVTPSVK